MSARSPIARVPLPTRSVPTTPVPPSPRWTSTPACSSMPRHDAAGALFLEAKLGMGVQVVSQIDEERQVVGDVAERLHSDFGPLVAMRMPGAADRA